MSSLTHQKMARESPDKKVHDIWATAPEGGEDQGKEQIKVKRING